MAEAGVRAVAPFRDPGPNEKRCIIRHALKLYSNLVVAGVYTVPFGLISRDEAGRLMRVESYVGAIAKCVAKYALLSAGIGGARGDGEVKYVRVEEVDVARHFRVVEMEDVGGRAVEGEVVGKVMEKLHSDPRYMFDDVENVPAWSVDVLLLEPDEEKGGHRVLIAFTYSHSHGDGMSGVAFHRTLLGALPDSFRDAQEDIKSTVVVSSTADLPEQVDAPKNMPIGLGFLLLPALCEYLPFVTRLFGIRGDPVSGTDEETWRGGVVPANTASMGTFVETNVEVVTLNAETMKEVLAVCRQKGVKLTALLNLAIVEAISTVFSRSKSGSSVLSGKTNFVAQVPVNLRRGLRISDDTLGNFGGGAYLRHTFAVDSKSESQAGAFSINESLWQTMRKQGSYLAKMATNLRNQPVGLLRYVTNLEAWLLGKVGKARECSWELSNLGSLEVNVPVSVEGGANGNDTSSSAFSAAVSIEQTFFSQPAGLIGAPLYFNVISVKGGSLSICVSWKTAALGLEDDENDTLREQEQQQRERRFVREVTNILVDKLGNLKQ